MYNVEGMGGEYLWTFVKGGNIMFFAGKVGIGFFDV